MRINARTIIRETRAAGIDPVEHAQDLADAYGWDEDMADDAVRRVHQSIRWATTEGRRELYV